MIHSNHLYWDTCIFISYLTDSMPHMTSEIDTYIRDAKKGKVSIYYSTVVLAEIRQEKFKSPNSSDISQFFSDLGSAFIAVDPLPTIMAPAIIQLTQLRPRPLNAKNASAFTFHVRRYSRFGL